MRKLFSAMLLLAALGVFATDLSARPLSEIIRRIGLTPQDYKMLSDTGESLYKTASPRPGRVVSWSNPESGSRGTARLAAMRANCAFVQHIVYPKGGDRPTEIRTRVCRNAEGKWLLQP